MAAGRFSLTFQYVTAEHAFYLFGNRYPLVKRVVTWRASTDWSDTGTLEEHLGPQSPHFGDLVGRPENCQSDALPTDY